MADGHLGHADIGCGDDHAGALVDDDTGDGVGLQFDATEAGEEIYFIGVVFRRDDHIHGASIACHGGVREYAVDRLSHASGRDEVGFAEIEIQGTVLNDLCRNFAFYDSSIRDCANGGVVFLNSRTTGTALTAEKASHGDGALSNGVDCFIGTLKRHLEKDAALERL